jgi:hypothetical protein
VFTIMAKTDPGDWFVDDVSANGVGATPLPATWTMLLIGLAGLGFVSPVIIGSASPLSS